MLAKDQTYAVIGASNDAEKYGHKVLKDLHESGYKVVPINPKGGEILGLKVFPDLARVPVQIDTAVFVVPPAVTEAILPQIKERGIKNVWLQPGSESQAAIAYCRNHGIDCVAHACIMIARAR